MLPKYNIIWVLFSHNSLQLYHNLNKTLFYFKKFVAHCYSYISFDSFSIALFLLDLCLSSTMFRGDNSPSFRNYNRVVLVILVLWINCIKPTVKASHVNNNALHKPYRTVHFNLSARSCIKYLVSLDFVNYF